MSDRSIKSPDFVGGITERGESEMATRKFSTEGLLKYTGIGSRLVRHEPSEPGKLPDDWTNVQVHEGVAKGSWHEGLLFVRLAHFEDAEGAYALAAFRIPTKEGEAWQLLTLAHGRNRDEAWLALYADLERAGLKPAAEPVEPVESS